jgi:lipopolysaccharide transport system permease protein
MSALSLLRYRSLLWFLTIRDWKEQTRRTFLGFFWMLAYPFVLGAIFAFLFGQVFRPGAASLAPSILCALIPWQLFSLTLSTGSGVLAKNHEMFRKVRFPTEVLLLSHILCRTLQFVAWLIVLELFLIAWGFPIGWQVLYIIPWLILQTLLVLGILLLLSPVGLVTRDIEQGLGLITLLWFYATPVIYPLSWVQGVLPAKACALYVLNPMVGIVEGYRSVLLDQPSLLLADPTYVWSLTAQILGIFLLGYFTYKKAEPYFAQTA